MGDRLSARRWLVAGLEQLAAHGPVGLRIMPIAESLRVTKGSFYWHFRDLDQYRSALLVECVLTAERFRRDLTSTRLRSLTA